MVQNGVGVEGHGRGACAGVEGQSSGYFVGGLRVRGRGTGVGVGGRGSGVWGRGSGVSRGSGVGVGVGNRGWESGVRVGGRDPG